MAGLRATVARVLQERSGHRFPSVLLQGETGTGKGAVARSIHRGSARSGRPFVDVNCAAIPANLLESEMFGFERGAFTDARQPKPGLFQAAGGGTIFLDEIALLSEELQAKLLKVVEDRVVRRLGGIRAEAVDVWVIAASNEDLRAAVAARRFRADLYHRLAVVTLSLPPLRDRGGDVILLARHFLQRVCAEYGLPPKRLTSDAEAALASYRWPGNIRELGNVVERTALLTEGDSVTAAMLALSPVRPTRPASRPADGPAPLETVESSDERARLRAALEETGWNVARAAARLGLSRNTIRYRIEKYGLDRHEPASPPVEGDGPEGLPGPTAKPLLRWEQRRVTFLRVEAQASVGWTAGEPIRTMEVILDKTRTFGGRVEELSSHRVIAAFGVEPVEDGPRRAANAARAIQNAVHHLREETGLLVSAILAIHVAPVMLVRLDDVLAVDGDDRLRVWSELEALAECGGPDLVVVSRDTVPSLSRQFGLEPLRSHGPEAYALVETERPGFALRGDRGSTFVDRDQDLATLLALFEAVDGGQGQVVGLVGEPGIGKSRLLAELRARLRGRSVRFLEARCVSYGSPIPYHPLLELVRAGCGLTDREAADRSVAKIRRALDDAGLDQEQTPYVCCLLGLPSAMGPGDDVSPDLMKIRIPEILGRLVLAWSARDPLVIVVEDLQWIDATSEETIAMLADVVLRSRTLLVTTHRPQYGPPWMARSFATRVALGPLTREDSTVVARGILREERSQSKLLEVIVTRAEGNPLFVEELARAASDGKGSATFEVPGTLEDVLRSRLDRLSAEARLVVQAAAVIGKDVPVRLLHDLTEVDAPTLARELARLREAELLYPSALGANAAYTFKHVLLREVAYAVLPETERSALHGRLVEIIERRYGDRLEEHVEELAHHAVQAGLGDKALVYLRHAGVKAALRSASTEACARFEEALTIADRLPRTRANVERAMDLRFDLRNPLFVLADFERALDVLEEIVRTAESLEDDERLGRACSYMANAHFMLGNLERGGRFAERAAALAESLDDAALRAITYCHRGQLAYARGDHHTASIMMSRTIESLGAGMSRSRRNVTRAYGVVAQCFQAMALGALGRFAEARVAAERCRAMTETTDTPFFRALAAWAIGDVCLLQGYVDDSVTALQAAVRDCDGADLRALRPWVGADLGYALVLSSRLPDAIAVLERARDEGVASRLYAQHSLRLAYLGLAYLEAGRPLDALGCGREALERSRAHGERGFQVSALVLLGRATLATGDRAAAVSFAEQARSLADELALQPLIAQCDLLLAQSAQRDGDDERVRQHLSAAATRFGALGMPYWTQKALTADP